MNIRIDKTDTIKNVQKAFADIFPFLKIEFFKTPHISHHGSPKSDMRMPHETALAYGKREIGADIEVNAGMKVSELEQAFQEYAGLSVQVFRKSGSVWIETSLTDDWTLGQQNSEGEMLSIPAPRIVSTDN